MPLSTQAAALFRKAIALVVVATSFVFPSRHGQGEDRHRQPRMQHTHGGSVTSAMRRLRAAAGVDDVSVHDMRRAVSELAEGPRASAAKSVIWCSTTKNPSVTEAHYSGTARMEKQVRAALQAWVDHVWAITGQSATASNVVRIGAAVASGAG